ncbi:NAD(P)/FAD-dependent oxidoreductase [Amycolatopsis sp. CB00013]|uniref:NAD(P)/FAD-dependent oxidoreductase n=1 Tax=Amycolatopsis sp. CB00013 TaxID=1703945 RepID=UPI00093C29D7|nr:FAD-dependent oxidoreductase [Amycolatopsis sp. CB00013]OKJ95578.1 pyridine nucleotide-disulfide oxidoreductase [Amycolatopsis sp. CB00013]
MGGLVVVGASLAGLRAVEAARKTGFDGPITLIGAEEHLPYDRPPLSKAFLAKEDTAPPMFRDEQVLRDELGVHLALGRPASGVDTRRRTVRVGDEEYGYDALVIATGARARTVPGWDTLRGVYTLRTLDDAIAVRTALTPGTNLVVVGAGFIGSEVASSARDRGLTVTIVEAQPTPLVRAVGAHMGAACSSLHARNGTTLRCGVGVAAIEGDGAVERVRLSDGTVLTADMVVVGVGASPATQWLAGSGLTLEDGVVCDETLHTGAPGVYAAGDVARWHNPMFSRHMRLEHWTSAAEQGALAARNALDPANARPYATVPYFWSDWYGSRFQFVGIPASDEVRVVDGDTDGAGFTALYREGDRLAGALTLNRPRDIMKYRRLIAGESSWDDGLAFAKTRTT